MPSLLWRHRCQIGVPQLAHWCRCVGPSRESCRTARPTATSRASAQLEVGSGLHSECTSFRGTREDEMQAYRAEIFSFASNIRIPDEHPSPAPLRASVSPRGGVGRDPPPGSAKRPSRAGEGGREPLPEAHSTPEIVRLGGRGPPSPEASGPPSRHQGTPSPNIPR